MNQATSPNPLANLKAALARDPKKAAVLASLVLVLGGLWMKMLLTGSTQPAAALAAIRPQPAASVGAVDLTPPPTLNSSQSEFQAWLAEPAQPLTRNLFAIKLDYFPTDASRVAKATGSEPDGFWTQLEKSLAIQADQSTKRENLIANLRTLASGLRLESTYMGTSPKAMINGALVGEGDVVATFRVVKIDPRRIIVEREGIRLEIQMK